MVETRRLILLIAQTHIQADGRALRFARSLIDAGYDVAGVGYAHYERSPPSGSQADFPVATCVAPRGSLLRRLLLATSMLPVAVHRGTAQSVYWTFPEHRRLLAAGRDLLVRKGRRPDLIIAKDWGTVPIAIRLAQETGARLHYDITEVSHAQFANDLRWRLLVRPFVIEIEREALRQAGSCTIYGDAGADHLQGFYNLSAKPTVVRNLPYRADIPERTLGQEINFLYHGLAAPVRHLEAIIDSVPAWGPERHLILRLTGKPDYIDSLKARATALARGQRITFAEPVPNDEVVAAASATDVGLCLLPASSEQFLLAEPNKLYQYIAAGLAVVASDLPVMRIIVERYGVGHLIQGLAPEEIADAINGMDREAIALYRAASQHAATELCWENEQRHLVDAIALALK